MKEREQTGHRPPVGRIGGLAEVSLSVGDLDESRRFYGEVLGLEDVTPHGQSAPVFFRISKTETGYSQSMNLFPAEKPLAREESPLHHLAFQIPRDLFEEEQSRLEEAGLSPARNDHPEIPVRSMYVRDPDGNWIELFSEAEGPEDAPANDPETP
jgi:catechol 2,3-dioxygenase-like lactoylglutathione lyase family enzyme